MRAASYVPAVIAALGAVKTPLGTYAVLGNNDYEACYDDILKEWSVRVSTCWSIKRILETEW